VTINSSYNILFLVWFKTGLARKSRRTWCGRSRVLWQNEGRPPVWRQPSQEQNTAPTPGDSSTRQDGSLNIAPRMSCCSVTARTSRCIWCGRSRVLWRTRRPPASRFRNRTRHRRRACRLQVINSFNIVEYEGHQIFYNCILLQPVSFVTEPI